MTGHAPLRSSWPQPVPEPVHDDETLRRMAAALHHRGSDWVVLDRRRIRDAWQRQAIENEATRQHGARPR